MKKLTYDMYAKYKEKYFIDIRDICHYRTNSFRNPYDLSHVKATYIKDYKNCSDFIKYIYYNMISPEMGTWAIKYNLFENFSKLPNVENIPVFVQDMEVLVLGGDYFSFLVFERELEVIFAWFLESDFESEEIEQRLRGYEEHYCDTNVDEK